MLSSQSSTKDIIDHIAIVVDNIERSLNFYTHKFKCKTIFSDKTWAILQFENIKLSLVVKEEHPPHIAIIDNSIINDPQSKTHRDKSISKYVVDLDNNFLELISYNKNKY